MGSRSNSVALVAVTTVVVVDRRLEAESDSSSRVGEGVSKATASITFLGDDGTSTFSSVETTAAGGTIGIRSARASNELSALGRSKESHWRMLGYEDILLSDYNSQLRIAAILERGAIFDDWKFKNLRLFERRVVNIRTGQMNFAGKCEEEFE